MLPHRTRDRRCCPRRRGRRRRLTRKRRRGQEGRRVEGVGRRRRALPRRRREAAPAGSSRRLAGAQRNELQVGIGLGPVHVGAQRQQLGVGTEGQCELPREPGIRQRQHDAQAPGAAPREVEEPHLDPR
ncbi:MAG: hypothetical protein M5U32_08385 [Myxococcota bacterium]|nr:hypothetical protein [Myxococcota bacterium]